MKNFKRVLLPLLCILVLCLLAGCGATVNTELSVDAAFAGQRDIDLVIGNEDLSSYVTGGIEALQTVADASMPTDLSYTVTADDSNTTITFTLNFTDLEDYKTKVAAIIAAGGETELVPEVIYDNQSTYFKKGVQLEENFDSFDLVRWYFNALQTANIITESSTSNWYSMGGNTVLIDGVEYSASSYDISVDDQQYYCFSDLDVETTMNLDGTFTRVFVLSIYEDTVMDLAENGCTVSSYLEALVPEGDLFEEVQDGSYYTYTITVTADDAAALTEKTNQILQTENAFSVEMTLDPNAPGRARVVVKESLDGSFYYRYDYGSPVESKIHVFDNSTFVEGSVEYPSFYDDVLSYSPQQATEVTLTFDWQITFATAQLTLDIQNEEKAAVELVLGVEPTLPQDIKDAAFQALESYGGQVAEIQRDGDSCTVSFEGTVEELNGNVHGFIYNAVAAAATLNQETDLPAMEEYGQLFELVYKESETNSGFTKGYTGAVYFDLQPVIGQTRIQIQDQDTLLEECYYDGYFTTDEEGVRTVESSSSLGISVIQVSLVKVILSTVFALMLLAGIALLLMNIKTILGLFAAMKEKSQQKKQAAAEAQTAQVQQPVYAAPAVEKPAEPVAEAPAAPEAPAAETEETEELL